eukprot:CAMPEP_0202917534 /NCGR_PEP_ID=MMETSP1392-20130828/71207_1 /ASSEMBLY_ACC=CAM_ASM_000868 /TAXON_ID=225041 /ORGANISM="Chlamydomonas chlamydogama, Strain SAG 11-48b" /LENGTH=96 /DNA_ID=CAMNT_0049610307 /DNA_START=57 /DNA_END=344 /DNA_ORIENTATION=-
MKCAGLGQSKLSPAPARPTKSTLQSGQDFQGCRRSRSLVVASLGSGQGDDAQNFAKAQDQVRQAQFYAIKNIEKQMEVLQEAEQDVYTRAEDMLRA